MNPSVLIAAFLSFANTLKFKNLFFIIICLFVINLFVPDFIPFIDEIILGLMAIILANLKKERQQEKQGRLIEGEVVNEDKK
jgi:hypothetical protein